MYRSSTNTSLYSKISASLYLLNIEGARDPEKQASY
jgi:hypothetical protein